MELSSESNELQSTDVAVVAASSIPTDRILNITLDNPIPEQNTNEAPAVIFQYDNVTQAEDTVMSTASQNSFKTIPSQIDEDERPCKKPKLDETVDEDGSLCVICYETWGQSGEHRITSLKCGHLFGHKCILRWLSENKVCPSCKAKATKRDIRFIYANKLVAMDTGELIRLQNELEKVKCENMSLHIENTSILCKLSLVNAELEKNKLHIQELMNFSISTMNAKPSLKNFSLKFVDSYLVCPHSSCRVMDYIPSKASIVVSLRSANNLFPGFGVKQFNSVTHASLSYIPLHTKAIRDVKFNQINARLLSVSLDKSFSIANLYSSDSNTKQVCNDMLWSCCWDATNSNIFYVGGQQGSIKVFDSRYITETPLFNHVIEGDMSPVVSIISTPSSPGSALPQGGFIACKLNSLWAFECSGSSFIKSQLPIEGPFFSMTYSDQDKHLLISARPNTREPCARHIICNLRKDASLFCDRIHTFSSGKVQKQLARSCFIRKDGSNYVATPNDNIVQLWNSETGFPVTIGKTAGPIIDLLPLQNQDGTHVLALGEKRINFFKLIDS